MGDPVEFGVDLYRLWVAGRVLLPQVAQVYEQDSQDIHNSSFEEAGAFTRLGVQSPVYARWRALRNDVQMLFVETALTLEAAGNALTRIAADYAAVDQAAAAEMRNRIAEYTGDSELPQPPVGGLDLWLPGREIETEVGADGVERPQR